jgi:hypothetical protein
MALSAARAALRGAHISSYGEAERTRKRRKSGEKEERESCAIFPCVMNEIGISGR